ncbi:MAG: recombination protein O N-terminal domain-containing protein [Candidatus Sungbacteria bacterium]|nr:recombination protein O N-terminal domain-containing protein [Candidatus Sungbacteria bacterium]
MYRTRTFVLGHTEKGEADLSFSLYTERFGLIRAVAQGVRLIDSHLGIVSSLEKQRLAASAATILSTIAFEGEDKAIWRVLSDFFKLLDTENYIPDAEHDRALIWFLLNLLSVLGYALSRDTDLVSDDNLREYVKRYEEFTIQKALGESLSSEDLKRILRLVSQSFERYLGFRFLFLNQTANAI